MIGKKNIFILILVLFSGCTLEVRECKDGETRCIGSSINTCEDGEWSGYLQCDPQKCEEMESGAFCVNVCEKDETKCVGNILLTCTEENVWPSESEGTACSGEEKCMSMQGLSFCANPNSSTEIVKILMEHNVECNDELRMCGENNTLYTCENDELIELQQCGSQICEKAPDGVMACLDPCEPGETMCDGNHLVTCNENGVFGKSIACADGSVCTKQDDSVYACVEGTMSQTACTEDRCIDNILYRCADGFYDNGLKCESGCGLNDNQELSCLSSSICKPGKTRCHGQGIERCSDSGVWKSESSAPDNAYCVMRDEAAEYMCEAGYKLDGNVCKSVCTAGCSEDGTTSTYCPGNGMTVMIFCKKGCNPETKYCNDCMPVNFFGDIRCGIPLNNIGDIRYGIPLRTAKDILKLRDAMNSGDISNVSWEPEDLSKAVYVVMNSIDMGGQKDWKGIGTADNPFTSGFVGADKNVKITGDLECLSDNCGFFGEARKSKFSNLIFDINVTNNAVSNVHGIGRVAGRCSECEFDHLTVHGHIDSNAYSSGGVVGISEKSVYTHIITSGIMEGAKQKDEPWYRPLGGLSGSGTNDVIKDSLSSVYIYTARDGVGGFTGIGKNCIFDNVSFIGELGAPLNTKLNPSRLGGIIGNGYAPNTIMNSRVIAKIIGRDAVGGFVGKLDQTNKQGIYNSFSVSYVTGEKGVSGMASFESSYQLQNIYSLSKSYYSIDSNGASVVNGYYDANLCTEPKGKGTIVNGDQVVYDGAEIMLETNQISLVEQLNKNLDECSKKVPSGYSCHSWRESVEVNLNNLVGLSGIKLPWPSDSILDEEYKAIDKLNIDLSKK